VALLRLFVLIIVVVAAVIAVDASWDKDSRSLMLRLRDEKELVAFVRDRALSLGQKAFQAVSETTSPKESLERTAGRESTPPAHVGAGGSGRVDKLTQEDRRALDRLIEERIRERGAPAGAN
jgi:hypothetical protein